MGEQKRSEKSYSTGVISRFALAIPKSNLNANKLDGQNKTGPKRPNPLNNPFDQTGERTHMSLTKQRGTQHLK